METFGSMEYWMKSGFQCRYSEEQIQEDMEGIAFAVDVTENSQQHGRIKSETHR